MKLGQKRLAKVTFLKLIHDYPKSIYTKFAKKDLAKLN
jgi:outer membrane protein assembly factor BamD (BamD/ComL family)